MNAKPLILVLLTVFSFGFSRVVSAQSQCSSAPPQRLAVGNSGYVTDEDTTPLNIRTEPGTHGIILAQMVAGDTFEVIDGPRCGEQGNNLRWWYVRSNSNVYGWIAEGSTRPSLVYFVAPLAPGQTAPILDSSAYPGDVPVLAGDFVLGTATVIVRGLNLRLQPSANAEILSVLTEGDILMVYVGPYLNRGFGWWYLSDGNRSGWSVDSVNELVTLAFNWSRPESSSVTITASGWAADDQPATVSQADIDYAIDIQRQVSAGTLSVNEAESRLEDLAVDIGAEGLEWLVRRVPIYDGQNWMSFDTYADNLVENYGTGNGTSRLEQDPIGSAMDLMFGNPSPNEILNIMGFGQ